jgi:hypothetical protein
MLEEHSKVHTPAGAGIGYASFKQGATNTAACPIRVSSEVPDMSVYRINRFVWHVRALTGPTATAHKPVVGVRRLHHMPNAGGEEPRVCLGQQREGTSEESWLVPKRHQRRIRGFEKRADGLGVLRRE